MDSICIDLLDVIFEDGCCSIRSGMKENMWDSHIEGVRFDVI